MKEFYNKHKRKIIFGLMLLLLLIVGTCSHNAQKIAEGEKKQLQEQFRKEKDGVKVFREQQKILFDSLSADSKAKDKKIADLHNSNDKLNKKLENSAKELENKKQSFKNKSFEQLAQVFKEQGYKDVSATPTSVSLEKDTPVAVLEDLAEGNNCFNDLQTKNEIIANKDEEIKAVNGKLLNKDLALASKQIEVEKIDGSLKTAEEINKKSDKIINNLKTKNFLTTYILPPLVFIGGVYVGANIVK